MFFGPKSFLTIIFKLIIAKKKQIELQMIYFVFHKENLIKIKTSS